ncbi:MAG: hypothetical protein E7642_08315 [Ruminococcaceae bacterium]|nr:hypothetical protein [Oscillospiraceae bacterium]
MSGYLKNVDPKKRKKTAKIPWSAIALAFVFIFNPNISIIDPLPDVFGYIILSASLVKLSMICDGLTDARRAFERMILIDGAKILALLWVFGIEATSERNSSLLLWSFVFCVLEIAFLAPAFSKLFDGFSELGNFHVNTSVHASKRAGGHSYTDKLKRLSVFFVVLKAIMAMLPELMVLATSDYDEGSLFFGMYRYVGIARALCFIPVMIVGVIWLFKAVCYFNRIRADRVFCDSISAAYGEKVLPKEGVFAIRNVKIATWLFVVGVILTFDFNLDGVNIFPDILVLAFLIPSFLYLAKSTKLSWRAPAVIAVLYGAASLLSMSSYAYYHANYTYNAMEKSEKAFFAYLFYVGSVALQGIIFVCMLAIFIGAVRKVIGAHTGYVLGREIESEGEKLRILEVHNELSKNFVHVLDVAVLYVLSDILNSLYGAVYAFADKNMGWFGIVNALCAVFFVAVSVRAVSELREAVQTKYMLE